LFSFLNHAAPSSVRNLQLDVRSSKSIMVTWEPPVTMNGNFKRYVVTYGTVRDNLNERRNSLSPSAVSYQLTELEEFTVYYVQVFAETSVSGKLSEIVDAKTLEDGMACNFECFVMLCYLLYTRTVIWEVSIQMRPGCHHWSICEVNVTLDFVISEVITNVHVDYTILFSFFSFSIKRAAPSAPPVIDKAKTEAEDAHTISVTWNEIVKEDQNGIILGYTVSYKVEGQPTELSLNTTDKNTVIKGLKPYTSYCISVRGYTKIGPSDWSPCTTVRTLQSGAV